MEGGAKAIFANSHFPCSSTKICLGWGEGENSLEQNRLLHGEKMKLRKIASHPFLFMNVSAGSKKHSVNGRIEATISLRFHGRAASTPIALLARSGRVFFFCLLGHK